MRPHEAPEGTFAGPIVQKRGEATGGAGFHVGTLHSIARSTSHFAKGSGVRSRSATPMFSIRPAGKPSSKGIHGNSAGETPTT